MKRHLLSSLAIALFVSSCNNSGQENTNDRDTTIVIQDTIIDTTANTQSLDINNIPISTADIGDFPFFTAPEGSEYINNPKVKAFDALLIAMPDGTLQSKEGKVYRSFIHPLKNSTVEITNHYLNKSYEEAILKAGGVKLFEGKLSADQIKHYDEKAKYKGEDGSMDVYNNSIKSYIIRRAEGDIYIQLEDKSADATTIQILQEKPLVQTIQKISSESIAKDIAAKGKSILYINFDTDKASLKADGIEVVDEIAKVLKSEADLKLTIEGHTDNTGDAAHNKKLSEDRAKSVVSALEKAGIDKTRLKAVGYGAERPLVANDSDENKAKNRRVELVKQ